MTAEFLSFLLSVTFCANDNVLQPYIAAMRSILLDTISAAQLITGTT